MLVAPRTRRARAAALAVALAAPVVLGTAAPAFASAGDSAVVSAVVSDGNVHVQSTKGLSRVTVVLCGGQTVVADSWAGEQLTGDVAVDGIVEAVFIHSGTNTTSDAQALLALLAGAGAVKGDSTGAIALYDADACVPEVVIPPVVTPPVVTPPVDTPPVVTPPVDTPPVVTPPVDTPPTNDGGTADPDGTQTPDPTLIIHSDPAPGPSTPPADTVVLGETLEQPAVTTSGSTGSTGGTPAVAPAVTTPGSTAGDSPAVAPAVEANLAHTGANSEDLALFGLGFLGAGVLAFAAGRRRRSTTASSAS